MPRATEVSVLPRPWGRRRLAGAAAAVLTVTLVLTVSLVATIVHLTRADPGIGAPPTAAAPVTVTAPGRVGVGRDEIAAAPMLSVAPADGRPGARMALDRPAVFLVPAPSGVGPVGVPAGFPHTPAGAVAQLGAILGTVWQRMDPPFTADVYAGWSAPGAPPVGGWVVLTRVRSFLQAAGLSRLEPGQVVVVTPVGALVKGVDGPDWTLACVLVTIRARVRAQARIAYGHCERMVWTGGRWLIGPGAAPARAPGTWPGSEAMIRAGWASWEESPPQ